MGIVEWETYKDFRIVPHLLYFDDTNPETHGKWIVGEVDIQPKNGGAPIKTLTLKRVYASTKQEAFRIAVEYGKREIDAPT